MKKPFWEQKTLEQMTPAEWESLCDGCAGCCLCKVEDDLTGEIFYTNVACKLLNLRTCRCLSYKKRQHLVPNCAVLTPKDVPRFEWLPKTCAYRLLARGKPLPHWHHLVSGDRELVHQLGISVKNKVISENYVHPDQLCDHIIIEESPAEE